MSNTISVAPKLNDEEVAALHRAADQARKFAMTIGRPMEASISPMQAGREGEPTVMLLVDKTITVTTDRGARVAFAIGLQPVPIGLADHWFVKAHNYKRYGAGPAVGAEPERDPMLPPRAPSLDAAVAEQMQQQGEALLDAKDDLRAMDAALAAKDAELEQLRAQLAAAKPAPPPQGPDQGAGAAPDSGKAAALFGAGAAAGAAPDGGKPDPGAAKGKTP